MGPFEFEIANIKLIKLKERTIYRVIIEEIKKAS